jgi:hypothetical protein
VDHLEAQTLICEALDREPVDAQLLESAKLHCRTCPECAAFVRSLAAVKRAPLPEPTPDLADRVMSVVRDEARAQQELMAAQAAAVMAAADAGVAGANEAGSGQPTSASPPQTTVGRGADGGVAELDAVARRRRQRTTLIALSSAAAVFVIVAGALAAGGIRQMTTPAESTLGLTGALKDARPADQTQATSELSAGASASAPAAPSASSAPSTSESAPSYVSVQGLAYLLTGPETVDSAQRKQITTIQTGLDGGTTKARAVWSVQGSDKIYIQDDTGAFLAFQPVTRTYSGVTYQLNSGDIGQFGDWPSLPAQITEPTDASGSPTFTFTVTDNGAKIYRLSSGSAAGIAVGPGSPASDPAAGNPGWTWWTPKP